MKGSSVVQSTSDIRVMDGHIQKKRCLCIVHVEGCDARGMNRLTILVFAPGILAYPSCDALSSHTLKLRGKRFRLV
jgi:hypothetical protein